MTGMGTTGVLEVTNLSTADRLSRSVVEAVGNAVDLADRRGETSVSSASRLWHLISLTGLC